jgi:hypothetical protein
LLAPTICLCGLAASIAAGIVRADLFAQGPPLPVLLAAGAEIALVGLLSVHVLGLGRRLKRTATMEGGGR